MQSLRSDLWTFQELGSLKIYVLCTKINLGLEFSVKCLTNN